MRRDVNIGLVYLALGAGFSLGCAFTIFFTSPERCAQIIASARDAASADLIRAQERATALGVPTH